MFSKQYSRETFTFCYMQSQRVMKFGNKPYSFVSQSLQFRIFVHARATIQSVARKCKRHILTYEYVSFLFLAVFARWFSIAFLPSRISSLHTLLNRFFLLPTSLHYLTHRLIHTRLVRFIYIALYQILDSSPECQIPAA